MKKGLSRRGQSYVRDMSPLMHADFSTRDQLYDAEARPDGYINMGTAESHLINDEAIDLIYKLSNRMKLLPKHLHYDYFYGSAEFRDAIAKHWQHLIFGPSAKMQITADNVSIGSGCSLALEMLATMIGDDGDSVLVPAPYYSGFGDDFTDRAGVKLIPVHCGDNLDKDAFEKAYQSHSEKGENIVGVLFSSPNNPCGTVYTPAAVKNVISFCMEHELEIVSDEIYAETIHDPDAKWVSTLSLVPDKYREHVHVTSSFAKDFSLSGFRTGFAISFNQDLLTGMHNLAYYSGVSTHTQALLTELLHAPELPALLSKNREQLRISYNKIIAALDEIDVKIHPAQGGIFVFADFSAYMDHNDFESEFALWEKIFKGLKINISPGQVFAAEKPGWFRICYAQPPAIVDEVCKRLSTLKG